jgi:phosphoribosylglycinamide formyltransferase-1
MSSSTQPLKIAVLVSGSGTTLQNLVDVIRAGQLDAELRIVIGSRAALKGIERAHDAGIMNFVVDRKAFGDDCAAFSKQVFGLIDDAQVDLVVLGGWLCLLDIPERYAGKLINIHPSLLPSFGGKGMYGKKVHQAVLDYGCKVSGCTAHFVDATYDTGPIILQRSCEVREDDTPETLAARVFEEEKIAFPEAIRQFAQGKLKLEGRRVRILP